MVQAYRSQARLHPRQSLYVGETASRAFPCALRRRGVSTHRAGSQLRIIPICNRAYSRIELLGVFSI